MFGEIRNWDRCERCIRMITTGSIRVIVATQVNCFRGVEPERGTVRHRHGRSVVGDRYARQLPAAQQWTVLGAKETAGGSAPTQASGAITYGTVLHGVRL